MLRSRADGSRSISVAWARLTNAPVAGFPIMSAASSVQKPSAAALSAAETAKAIPPAKTKAPRRRELPAIPISGSSALPKRPGRASTRPTSP
jgi:hypothetical protein